MMQVAERSELELQYYSITVLQPLQSLKHITNNTTTTTTPVLPARGMAYIKSHSLFQYFLYLIINFLN